MSTTLPSTRIEVSLAAIRNNIKNFIGLINPKSAVLPVIKSNAYGHGLGIAPHIEDLVLGFGVINVLEGVSLRKLGIKKRVIVLGATQSKQEWQLAQKYQIETGISDSSFLSQLSAKLPPLKVHIELNTGFNRLGIEPHELETLYKEIQSPNVQLQGIYSHLADSENPASRQTDDQLKQFQTVLRKNDLITRKLDKHIAASAGALLFPKSHYDFVRVGISLYGFWPSKETQESFFHKKPFQLQPALTYKTTIVCTHELPRGSLISYGGTYRTRRQSRIATIPIGYYEGVNRFFSNKGVMTVHGKPAPIVGNVCMNMTMLDITNIPEARVGSEVIFFNTDPTAPNSVENLAESIDTIPYTLVTNIPEHIARVYINSDK